MSITKFGSYAAAVVAAVLLSTAADAQQPVAHPPLQAAAHPTMTALTAQGYEIKTATVAAGFILVFVQKGKDVFVCTPPGTEPKYTCSAVE